MKIKEHRKRIKQTILLIKQITKRLKEEEHYGKKDY